MYTVKSNSKNEGLDFHSFNKQFLNICSQHKHDGRALAFAFILYDFTNPQIAEVLDKESGGGLNQGVQTIIKWFVFDKLLGVTNSATDTCVVVKNYFVMKKQICKSP